LAELKTQPTGESVEAFLASVDGSRQEDCRALAALMTRVTGVEPRMWGSSIVGFGDYHYRYASGRQGEWFVVGFAPRMRDLTVYLMPGLEQFAEPLTRLGKHREGKGCLYVRKLADIDMAVLEELIASAVATAAKG
jgi:hypothetical protein